jgi:hypothetical protein
MEMDFRTEEDGKGEDLGERFVYARTSLSRYLQATWQVDTNREAIVRGP